MKTRALIKRCWESPSLTTWASLVARSLNLVVVLPLVLKHFSTEEVVVWQLFATILSMQLLLDLGLTPTFSRLIAYAMGGTTRFHSLRFVAPESVPEGSKPNWSAVAEIWTTMAWLYRRLLALAFFVLATFGTLALLKPLSALGDRTSGWLAWSVVVITGPLIFSTTLYGAYLQGVNEVAMLRRWEALTACGAICSSVLVVLMGGRLLALTASIQIWTVVNVWRNRRLAEGVAGGILKRFSKQGYSREMLRTAWPAAWRSGLGVFLTAGFVQLTGVFYAQVAAQADAAAYLIAMRLITAVSQFSQAPFYSKLPLLARMHAQGRTLDMLGVARRGMRLALWTYVLGVSVVAFGMKPALGLLGSSVMPVPSVLWWLLAAAFLAERFGAMHLQLYSLTNHIVWHIVTLVSGTISITTVLFSYSAIGVYAFPVSFIAGYCGFYSWYCARKVYATFGMQWLQFESSVGLTAAFGFCLSAGLQFWINHSA